METGHGGHAHVTLMLTTPGVNEVTLDSYHSDSLQVDLGSPKFLPAVMFVALPLRNPAKLSGRLKDVFDQRTTTNLVCWDLKVKNTRTKLRVTLIKINNISVCDEGGDTPLDLWSARDIEPAAVYSTSYSEGCTRHRTTWWL